MTVEIIYESMGTAWTKLATPGSAVRLATDFATGPGINAYSMSERLTVYLRGLLFVIEACCM